MVSQDRASAQRELGPLDALIGLGLRGLRNRECQTAAKSQDGDRFSLQRVPANARCEVAGASRNKLEPQRRLGVRGGRVKPTYFYPISFAAETSGRI